MPYEALPTQIQMAPLNMLPGVRLHTSRLRDPIVGRVKRFGGGGGLGHTPVIGMGQDSSGYTTFSTPGGDYQLTSTGQLFDPNGNVVGTFTGSSAGGYQTISTPSGDYQLVGNTLFAPSGAIVGTNTGAASFGTFLQQNAPLLLGGVGVLFVIAIIAGGRR